MPSCFDKWNLEFVLKGFSQLNMTAFEAGRVLAKAARHLGLKEIPDEYLKEGRLGEILIPDDYKPIEDVSFKTFTVPSGLSSFC